MEDPQDLATQRVERALRRFEESWRDRWLDATAVDQDIDELDVAVGLWLDVQETSAGRRKSTSHLG